MSLDEVPMSAFVMKEQILPIPVTFEDDGTTRFLRSHSYALNHYVNRILMDPVEVNVVAMVTKKERLQQFQEIPEVKSWLDGAGIKPTTRTYYAQRLYEFLGSETPKQFIDRALQHPREVSIQIKGKIGPLALKSASIAFHMRAAIRSFLEFYETDVHVNGKLKLRRSWKKPYLSWADAEKFITKTREPYESVFRFMLWSGLGADEVLEINSSPQIQANITKQVSDGKDYVVIDLEPRKQTLTRYFTVCPRGYIPKFPIHSLPYRIRGGRPITRQHLEARFRKAAKQVGLYQIGMGPHTLRSVFTSQCAMCGVAQAVCEFVKGHGAGDKYGYAREVLNEKYLIGELRKLQAPSVKDLEVENTELKEQLVDLQVRVGRFETFMRGKAAQKA